MRKITSLACLLTACLTFGQEMITDGGFESIADGGATNGSTIVQGWSTGVSKTPNGVWYGTNNYATIFELTSTGVDLLPYYVPVKSRESGLF